MDKLVRKIEIPMAKKRVQKAGLYLAQKKDLKHLARVSASAYRDYPLHNWLSNGTYDEKAAEKIMLISLKTMYKDAVIYAESEEMKGFAVWLPFGFGGSKVLPFLLNGGVPLIFGKGPGFVGRLVSYENYAMKLKRSYTDHYDWYLFNLCVRKDAQGQGIGKKLLLPMLKFCDEEQMVSYLETNKDVNVPMYRSYGFELMKEEMIPKSSVMHYAMVRRPKKEQEEV